MCPPSSLNSASSKNSFNTKKWKLRNHKDTFKIHKDHIWLLYSPLLSWLRIWTLEREVLWQEVRFPPFYYLELNRITAVPQKANIKLNETNQHLFAFCSAASCAAPSRSPLSLSLRPLMKSYANSGQPWKEGLLLPSRVGDGVTQQASAQLRGLEVKGLWNRDKCVRARMCACVSIFVSVHVSVCICVCTYDVSVHTHRHRTRAIHAHWYMDNPFWKLVQHHFNISYGIWCSAIG